MVLQLVVDGNHFAAHRSEQLGHSLDGFNRAERLASVDRAANLRQLDVYDVAKLLLRVIGNTDFAGLPVDPDPFVVLGVFPVSRIRHASLRAGLKTRPYTFRL